MVDFINTADHIRTAFAEYWGECVWGAGQAAAEARAAAEVDACLTRVLALLRCDTGVQDDNCGAETWENLTLGGAARRLLLSAEGAGEGGSGRVEMAVRDLERYIDLCQRMNAQKLELPLQVATELRKHVLASAAASASASASSSSDPAGMAAGSYLRLKHVELTHAGAIHVGGGEGRKGEKKMGMMRLETSSSSLVSEALMRAGGGVGVGGGVASSGGAAGIKGKGGGGGKQGEGGGEGKTLRELAQLCAVASGVNPKLVTRHVTHLHSLLHAVLAGSLSGSSSSGSGVDVSGVTGILQRLDLLPITKQVLVETGIGMTMKQLSKHSHPRVSAHARSLVARWKALLRPTYPLSLPAAIASHPHGGHLMWPDTREHMIVKLQGALRTPAGQAGCPGDNDTSDNNEPDVCAAPGAAHLACAAREIELEVACASVHVARGSGGAGAGGSGVGKNGCKDWYHQKVRQLLFNLRDGLSPSRPLCPSLALSLPLSLHGHARAQTGGDNARERKFTLARTRAYQNKTGSCERG